MKPRYFLLAFSLLPCPLTFRAAAQSLTLNDVLPPAGATYHTFLLDAMTQWDTLSGPGIVWDMAAISVSPHGITHTVLDPAEAPDIAAYPDAGYVVFSVHDDGLAPFHDYCSVADGEVHHLARVGTVQTVFAEPELLLSTPMELGDEVHSTHCATVTFPDVVEDQCGDAHVTYDAHGTLVLPYNTFTNVRRVTHWRSSTPVTGGGGTTVRMRRDWFVPGMPFPLLTVQRTIMPDGEEIFSARMLDENAFVGLLERTPAPLFTATPNPSTGPVVLRADVPLEGTLTVCAADGRRIMEVGLSGGTQRTVDLSGLAEGVYHLVLTSGGQRRSVRVVRGG